MLFEYWRSCILNSNYFDENIKENELDCDNLDDRDFLLFFSVFLGIVLCRWSVHSGELTQMVESFINS